MSHGPSRAYQTHIYPTIPSNTLAIQHPHQQQQQVLNQQFQQTLVTGGPSPPLAHLHSINNNSTSHAANSNNNTTPNSLTVGSHNRNNNNTNSSNSNNNSDNNTIQHHPNDNHHHPNNNCHTNNNHHHSNDTNNNHIRQQQQQQQNIPAKSTQETLYCDSCQTFRHISFFSEKDFKYPVCNLCHTREMQKRKHQQMERFEIYNNNNNDNEKSFKQCRFSIQQQQYHHHNTNHNQSFQQLHSNAPNQITLPNNNNTSKNTPTIHSSSPQMKQSPHINQQQQPPSIASLIPSLTAQITSHPSANNDKHTFSPSNTNNTNTAAPRTIQHAHIIQTLPLVLPPATSSSATFLKPETTIQNNTPRKPAMIHNSRNQNSDKFSQELITLDTFVLELKKEMSIFDRKPFHLDISPLIQNMGENAGFTQLGRGICEYVLEGTKFNFSLKDRRRSTKSPDTLSTLRYYCSQRADTAKPRKAEKMQQNRYECAGALTMIIDLLKKTAHVTVIHKSTHPPFVSQQKSKQQVYQQQLLNLKLLQQEQKRQEVDQRFDLLRQKVSDLGHLLEQQQAFGNKHFLKVATEALSGANELLVACKDNTPLNKRKI